MPQKLFIYGTLHPDIAPQEIRADVRRLHLIGKGTIRGKLLDLGAYPGVLLEEATTEQITGHIFEIPSDPTLLHRLDRYEEFFSESPETSLFLRQLVTVQCEDSSTTRCWVYALNPSRVEHTSAS